MAVLIYVNVPTIAAYVFLTLKSYLFLLLRYKIYQLMTQHVIFLLSKFIMRFGLLHDLYLHITSYYRYFVGLDFKRSNAAFSRHSL